jgi:hypothetical protein
MSTIRCSLFNSRDNQSLLLVLILLAEGFFIGEIMSNYNEKLKDPRWQKLRLKILERDDWICQKCYSAEKTLCVHHLYYVKGCEPWEYNLDELVTTCEDCHEVETADMNTVTAQLLKEIKKKLLFSDNLHELWEGFHFMDLPNAPEIVASALCEFFSNKEKMNNLVRNYFKELEIKPRKLDGKPTN